MSLRLAWVTSRVLSQPDLERGIFTMKTESNGKIKTSISATITCSQNLALPT